MKQDKDKFVYAGFFVRLAAYAIDSILMFLLLFIPRLTRFIISLSNPESVYVKDLIFQYSLSDLLIVGITALYFVMMTYLSGSTIGKRLLNIKVVSVNGDNPSFGSILYRETVGRFLSTAIFHVGYLMMIVLPDKKSLHDMLSDTRVVYIDFEKAEKPNFGQPAGMNGQNGFDNMNGVQNGAPGSGSYYRAEDQQFTDFGNYTNNQNRDEQFTSFDDHVNNQGRNEQFTSFDNHVNQGQNQGQDYYQGQNQQGQDYYQGQNQQGQDYYQGQNQQGQNQQDRDYYQGQYKQNFAGFFDEEEKEDK